MKKSDLIIVRGAGDLATGTINRLKKSGFRLLVLETDYPAAIRRQVALSEAVYSKSACVEGVEAVRVKDEKQMLDAWKNDKVPVMVDPMGESIASMQPKVESMRFLQSIISELIKIWHHLLLHLVLVLLQVSMWML